MGGKIECRTENFGVYDNKDDNMDDNIIVMYFKINKFVSHLMAMLRFMDDNMDDNILVMYIL